MNTSLPITIPTTVPPGGRKDDEGKLRLELVDPYIFEGLASVFQHGAEKYGEGNWKKGFVKTRLIGALLRHVVAYQKGERVDPDSGLHPMLQAAANALIIYYQDTHPHVHTITTPVEYGQVTKETGQ